MRRFRGKGKAVYIPKANWHEIYDYRDKWFKDYQASLPKIREMLEKGYRLRLTQALTESQAERLSADITGETKFIPVSEWMGKKVGFLLYKPAKQKREKKEEASQQKKEEASQPLDQDKLKQFLGAYTDIGGGVLSTPAFTRTFIPNNADPDTVGSHLIAGFVKSAIDAVEEASKSNDMTPLRKLTDQVVQKFAGKRFLLDPYLNVYSLDEIKKAKDILGEPSGLVPIKSGWVAVKGRHGILLLRREPNPDYSSCINFDEFKREMMGK